jgi:hypothetical protein
MYSVTADWYHRYAQSSAGTSASAWTTGWTEGYFENRGTLTPSAGSAVWDDRPIAGAFRDLRSTLETGATCTVSSDCTTAIPGRRPALPGATCNAAGFCVDGDGPWVRTDFEPFTRGPAPGIYADYDDWVSIRWGIGEFLRPEASLASPAGLPLLSTRECGPIPRHPEPGGSPIITTPPLDDRVVNAHLYTQQVCDPGQPCPRY